MRIACPSCAAEYEVPASRLTPRKIVRCARCGGEWMPVREAEDMTGQLVTVAAPAEREPAQSAEPAMALPAVTAMDRLAASPVPAPSRAGLIGAWVLTFVVLVAAIGVTIAYQREIVSLWPPSGRILAPIDHMMTKPAVIARKAAE
jgi:predicted Zn finger-like uncharacterized protein